MKVVHRISLAASPVVRSELANLGVEIAPTGMATFEIDEQDERWPALTSWIAQRDVVDVTSTKFSEVERAAAEWLELTPDWQHGYPQPDEGSFGYIRATYDLSDACEVCGVGRRQVAPFQMKGEPKWGRRGIMQMHWVFDEFFVTPEVYDAVFEPFGVTCRPVIDRRGDELGSVVQLVIDVKADVITDGLVGETCDACGRTKYLPVVRGRFPALVRAPEGTVAKTHQWFGSGGSAARRVLVAQRVRHALLAAKVRGASVRPVTDGGSG